MSEQDNHNKLNLFDEFFSIKHLFNINIVQPSPIEMPSFNEFIDNMPLPFKLATDVITLDQAALRPLQALSGVAGQLVEYLNHQTQKIDLLVSYILSQQDEEIHRHQGIAFGGSGVIFKHSKQRKVGEHFALKIFLLEESCAIYCYVEVIDVVENTHEYEHKAIFHHIRDEDREILVRSSLHQQSKQLQLLAQQRKQKNNV
ncbi:MAG: hypothetical protein ACI9LM_000797 [Alteromonadaceae bacterium]|jgi:hypothetical protein